jgi:flagellar capping protein FliD
VPRPGVSFDAQIIDTIFSSLGTIFFKKKSYSIRMNSDDDKSYTTIIDFVNIYNNFVVHFSFEIILMLK